MNSLLRKGINLFKTKNISLRMDDEWILCDVKNKHTNENLVNNNTKYPKINKKRDIQRTFDLHICSHNNGKNVSYVNKNELTNNIQKPLIISLLPLINDNPSLTSQCYEVFMNLVEEIDLLKVIFMLSDMELPAIGI